MRKKHKPGNIWLYDFGTQYVVLGMAARCLSILMIVLACNGALLESSTGRSFMASVHAQRFHNRHTTGELGYDGPLYDGFLHMTDDMLGPSPLQIKYSSYVYDGFCILRTNFPGPIESVISKFTCSIPGPMRQTCYIAIKATGLLE